MKPAITPETRVGDLLDAYPDAEAILIGVAPAFAKLKNPILRRTVAKVATLEQAARIAALPCNELVRYLREQLGLQSSPTSDASCNGVVTDPAAPDTSTCSTETPDWAAGCAPTHTIDADAMLKDGTHPLGTVTALLAQGTPGSVIVIRSSFYPAPLIERMKAQAEVACVHDNQGSSFVTYMRCR